MVLENDDKGEVLATLVIVWEGRGRVDCVCVCGKGDRGAECLVHGCLSVTLMCGLRGEDRGSSMCGRGKWGEVRKCPVNVGNGPLGRFVSFVFAGWFRTVSRNRVGCGKGWAAEAVTNRNQCKVKETLW